MCPIFTQKVWVNLSYGFQARPKVATHWDHLPRPITLRRDKSTMVRFELRSHGKKANVLTTRPYTHIFHNNFLSKSEPSRRVVKYQMKTYLHRLWQYDIRGRKKKRKWQLCNLKFCYKCWLVKKTVMHSPRDKENINFKPLQNFPLMI